MFALGFLDFPVFSVYLVLLGFIGEFGISVFYGNFEVNYVSYLVNPYSALLEAVLIPLPMFRRSLMSSSGFCMYIYASLYVTLFHSG